MVASRQTKGTRMAKHVQGQEVAKPSKKEVKQVRVSRCGQCDDRDNDYCSACGEPNGDLREMLLEEFAYELW